jgi:hypothetical protein
MPGAAHDRYCDRSVKLLPGIVIGNVISPLYILNREEKERQQSERRRDRSKGKERLAGEPGKKGEPYRPPISQLNHPFNCHARSAN